MRPIIVVDDMREFPGIEATYLRTLDEAMNWWRSYRDDPYPASVWLDHDLGGSDEDPIDVRPLVREMEAHLLTVGRLPISVRILTDSYPGRIWIRNAFWGLVPVSEDIPDWRVVGTPL